MLLEQHFITQNRDIRILLILLPFFQCLTIEQVVSLLAKRYLYIKFLKINIPET